MRLQLATTWVGWGESMPIAELVKLVKHSKGENSESLYGCNEMVDDLSIAMDLTDSRALWWTQEKWPSRSNNWRNSKQNTHNICCIWNWKMRGRWKYVSLETLTFTQGLHRIFTTIWLQERGVDISRVTGK